MIVKRFSVMLGIAVIFSILFSGEASAKTLSNILSVKYTVNLADATAQLVSSFNKESVNDLKLSADRFINIRIGSLTSQELEKEQKVIDEYFGQNNSISLESLRNDYNSLSNLERLAVAKLIKDTRNELPGCIFLEYYRGQFAFLPAYSQALSTIKTFNGSLINVVWNSNGESTISYKVSENITIKTVIKAEIKVKDFSINNVKYIITCIDESTSEPVANGVIDGVVNGEKEVVTQHRIINEEIKEISLTFNKAGDYKIIIRAKY